MQHINHLPYSIHISDSLQISIHFMSVRSYKTKAYVQIYFITLLTILLC